MQNSLESKAREDMGFYNIVYMYIYIVPLSTPTVYIHLMKEYSGLHLERGVRGAKVKIFGGANMD